jgi:hypothetical protein
MAHYIRWCEIYGIPDPCGNDISYQLLVGIYTKFVMMGVNYNCKSVLRSATVRGYAVSVDALFLLRDFELPVDISNHKRSTITKTLVHNLEREEGIAKQRSPLDQKIYLEIVRKAQASKNINSIDKTLNDITTINRYLGCRASEYAQTKQDEVDYFTYPSGNKVVRAFTRNDFVFKDKDGAVIDTITDATIAHRVTISWRIQKNRENFQGITLPADPTNPSVCPVKAALQIVLRAHRLNQPDDLPLVVYANNRGRKVYLTGAKIAEVLRKIVKVVYPTISLFDLSKFSAHSFRVWACVLLDEQGKSPEYIKKRLRWLGESFRTYLRDTAAIQDQHRTALQNASHEIEQLLAALPDDIVEITAGAQSIELSEYEEDPNLD